MNITMLSMQEGQEIQVANIASDLSQDHFEGQTHIFEIGQGIVEAGETISEGVETSAVLESIRLMVSNEANAIPNSAMQAIKLSIEHMTARLGYEKSFKMLSMESYANDPKESIKIAMEGISDILNSIWEAIKNAIKKVVGWMDDFFKLIFGHSLKVGERAAGIEIRLKKKAGDFGYSKINEFDYDSFLKDLDKQTENIKNRTKTSEELLNFSAALFPYVRYNNSNSLKGSDVVKHYEDSIKYLKRMFEVNVKNKAKSAVLCCQSLMSFASGENSVSDDLNDQFVKTAETINQMAIEIIDGRVGYGRLIKFESPRLLGDYSVQSNKNTKDKDFNTVGYKCSIDKDSAHSELRFGQLPSILGIKECLELSISIKNNSSVFEKKDLDTLKEILDEILMEIGTKKSVFKDEKEGEIWKSVQNKIKDLIQMVNSAQIKLSVETAKYVQNLNNNLLAYIVKCEKINDLLAKEAGA